MLHRNIIELSQLRPTQITVGFLQVKYKRRQLRLLAKRPSELVDFILEHPIRVVLGPGKTAYVIDHHHLALALIKERFETAPMEVTHDFSGLTLTAFRKKMLAMRFFYAVNAHGKRKLPADIPQSLEQLKDDPYRSLAGFVREAGGFLKVPTPYTEFLWAEFYRTRIKKKLLKKDFDKALKEALVLAHHKDARALPGYIKTPAE